MLQSASTWKLAVESCLRPGRGDSRRLCQAVSPLCFGTRFGPKDSSPKRWGLLVRDQHPALAAFPTRSHSDWQWHEVAIRSRPIVIDPLPQLNVIVQPIDDWKRRRRQALVFEASVSEGHLVATSVDFSGNLDERPVARQLRHSLLTYLAGRPSRPTVSATVDQLWTLLRRPEPPKRP